MASLITGSLAASNASVGIATDVVGFQVGIGAVGVNIGGTFVGTVTFEATVDGVNWVAVGAFPMLASGVLASAQTTTTTTGLFTIPVYGYNQVRARLSAFTSGTATVTLDVSTSADVGMQFVNTEGQKPSYFGSLAPLAVAASATDVACLIGSATKTIRVARVLLSCSIATAAAYLDIACIKRSGGGPESAVNTAWASTNSGPMDSNDAALTAGGGGFTATPGTLGTSVGVVAAARYFAPLTGTPALGSPLLVFDFGNRPTRMPVLRGTSQLLAVGISGTGPANASTWDVTFEWTEE